MTAIFGPQNANAANQLPVGTSTQRYGFNQTWVKDCSAPGANDGTVLDAAFYNRIIGNLEYLASQSGINATPGDMTVLYRAVLAAVSNGAPELLDTIKELADALADDPHFAVTMSTQLSYRLRFDASQSLTLTQKIQARQNLGLKPIVLTGSYNDLVDKPELGTAAGLNYGTNNGNAIRLDPISGKLPAVDGSLLSNVSTAWANVSGKPSFGTAAGLNVGVAAGDVVQLATGGKLPAVDGSNLTGVLSTPVGAIQYNAAQTLSDSQRRVARSNSAAAINDLSNLSFAVSASSGDLTIALKDANGNDATGDTPIVLAFRNATRTTGVLEYVSIASATSIVIPSGRTLGFGSATAGRLWVIGWNDGGTFRLGVFNASDASTVYALDETGIASTVDLVASGNASGVQYTRGVAVAAKTFRILGFIEWGAAGVTTAGTWTTTNLSGVQTFGPGVKKPGDVVQRVVVVSSGSSTTSVSMVDVSGASRSITPTAEANVIRVNASWTYTQGYLASTNVQYTARFSRNGTAIGFDISANCNTAGGGVGLGGVASYSIWDRPNSKAALTYKMQHLSNNASSTASTGAVNMQLEEIMG